MNPNRNLRNHGLTSTIFPWPGYMTLGLSSKILFKLFIYVYKSSKTAVPSPKIQSPLNRIFSSWSVSTTWSVVWPGVWWIVTVAPSTFISCPSCNQLYCRGGMSSEPSSKLLLCFQIFECSVDKANYVLHAPHSYTSNIQSNWNILHLPFKKTVNICFRI